MQREKRWFNKILTFLLSVICIVSLCQNKVNAEETFGISIDQYKAQDGKLSVYINHNQERGYCPTIEQSKLLVGKQTVNVEDIKVFRDTGEPVSYLMMLDVRFHGRRKSGTG